MLLSLSLGLSTLTCDSLMGLLKVQMKISERVMSTDVPTLLCTLMDAHIRAAPGKASAADTSRYALRSPRRL